MKSLYLIIISLLLLQEANFAQEKVEANFEVKDNSIYIYFKFEGDPDDEYKVNVKLRRGQNVDFAYEPKSLKGDIGEGYFAQKMCTIIWELLDSETQQFADGDDFYFEVSIEEVGISPWYYYIGSAALLGGGTIAAILLGGKSQEETSTTKLPSPPARP
ncbi:MAG: hypothetical protein HBSAPP04_00380 [Ignavibacteriaceae bacterium]|nr:MAG: hypothetical protein HBSAPP04_00380 [Ignavibacteriaceae bacterium]